MPFPKYEPGPNDIVIFRDAVSIVLHVPDSPREWISFESYDEAMAYGKELARKRCVDFWCREREGACLLARRVV